MHYGFWTSKTKTHSEALVKMNKVLAGITKIKSTDVILEAGCGVGGSCIWLAKNRKARVIGITISKNQVKAAKAHAKYHKVDKLVKFYNMDYTNTKFKSNSFDVIWAIESVNHAQKKRDFLKESYRLLKKGGRLVVADGFTTGKKPIEKDRILFDKWLENWG